MQPLEVDSGFICTIINELSVVALSAEHKLHLLVREAVIDSDMRTVGCNTHTLHFVGHSGLVAIIFDSDRSLIVCM